MRRLSPRRLFLLLVCGVSSVFLLVNIEQHVYGGAGAGTGSSAQQQTEAPAPSSEDVLSASQEENLSRKLTGQSNIHSGKAEEVKHISKPSQTDEKTEPTETVTSLSTSTGKSNSNEATVVYSKKTRPPLHLDRRTLLGKDDTVLPDPESRAWYMKGGSLFPHRDSEPLPVWPEELSGDRIPEQLMYIPETSPEEENEPSQTPLKKILLWNGASSWGGIKPGRGVFLKEKCPVSSCVISSNRQESESSDLILFKDHFSPPAIKRSPNQVWMLYLLECPLHTQIFHQKHIFNWTATYRSDSTIVAPYERWQYYNENVKRINENKNYAENKTKQVAWFVSNCGARNGRLQYARELGNYIGVDIYGACGTKKCPRSEQKRCFSMLNTDYKFYLAFENSNCKEYITEKFFVNGLGHDVIPIVMGARYEDYVKASPEKSFIHVDQFKSPKELAAYLHELDSDDEKYNEYFQWKGTGEFINTKFFCRVCAMIHDTQRRPSQYRSIANVNEWWRGDGTCVSGSWNQKSSYEEISSDDIPEEG